MRQHPCLMLILRYRLLEVEDVIICIVEGKRSPVREGSCATGIWPGQMSLSVLLLFLSPHFFLLLFTIIDTHKVATITPFHTICVITEANSAMSMSVVRQPRESLQLKDQGQAPARSRFWVKQGRRRSIQPAMYLQPKSSC